MDVIKFTNESLTKNCEVHLLPFKIQYTGEAQVKSFFSSSITLKSTDDKKNESKNSKFIRKNKFINFSKVFENSFRGRPLNGIKVKFNQNETGFFNKINHNNVFLAFS